MMDAEDMKERDDWRRKAEQKISKLYGDIDELKAENVELLQDRAMMQSRAEQAEAEAATIKTAYNALLEATKTKQNAEWIRVREVDAGKAAKIFELEHTVEAYEIVMENLQLDAAAVLAKYKARRVFVEDDDE